MSVIEPTPPQDAPAATMRHILLVDDDQVFGDAIGQTLRRAGFHVTFATGFQAALEVLEGTGPLDLLLADIAMPAGVNGIALSRMARLRRHDLKVVYLTGYNIPGVEREALGPILKKPIDDVTLIREVEAALAAA